MQLLQRRALINLTRNVLNAQKRFALPATSTLTKNGDHLKSFSTKSEKKKLLRYPAFPLNETLDRFMKTAEPHLTPEEYEKQKEITLKFFNEDGEKLHKLLEQEAAKSENWLAPRWVKAAYMQYRDPVTVFVSPGMAFPVQKFENLDDYVCYTGKFIYGLLKYKELINDGKIPVAKMGKFELDNSQFEKVFGTIRVPVRHEDKLEYYPDSKYIVVVHKNHFYKLDVYDKCGKPMSYGTYATKLKEILTAEEGKEKGLPIGVLTNDNRDSWAEAYVALMKDPVNKASVEIIQRSLFTVSLDECINYDEKTKLDVLGSQLIHGGGADCNAANRWMDKTIQVVVNPNGISGFCYEHSPAEGQPIALMVDYILKNLKNEQHYQGAGNGDLCLKKLSFNTNDCLDQYMALAANTVNRLSRDLQVRVLQFKSYGKEFCKKQKLSPDSFIQMALQYAFYKMHSVPAAQYESAHLRIYDGGRTETIRSCSTESMNFAKGMLDDSLTDEKRVELLRAAVNSHQAYTKLALEGRGVDRHLLGLKLMALENCLPVPEYFYSSPAVTRSNKYRVTTSQVASAYEAFMAYGPTELNGYACCYNPRPNDFILAMSAWRSDKETNLDLFAKAVEDALKHMFEVLAKAGIKPESKL